MYAASNEFHEAVRKNKPQIPLLIFDDAVFSSEDIRVDVGISFNDYFNLEDDISIGQTPSNEISFTLFNDDGLLTDYEFGEFKATIGVLISEGTYKQTGTVVVASERYTYTGSLTYPYLKRNNKAMAIQPTFPVKSMLIYNAKLYVFGEYGFYKVYNEYTGAEIHGETLIPFMAKKVVAWKGHGYYYNDTTRLLTDYIGGKLYTYEFVPLGVFSALRPNYAETIEIDFNCNDRMQKFETDMPTFYYPTTIGGLFASMCQHVGVPYETANFMNSNVVIEEEPEEFKSCTMRDVLAWIAEAAGSNAHFDRDGVLQMAWIRQTNQTYDENSYADFRPFWYETPRVDQLYNRDTDGNGDEILGGGSNPYLIQDNPFFANPVPDEIEPYDDGDDEEDSGNG